MGEFDFRPQVTPMQGVSMQDLIAARTPSLTTVAQGMSPILQAIQARRMQMMKQQQLAQFMQNANQAGISEGTQSMSPEQMYGAAQLGIDPMKVLSEFGAGHQAQREMDYSTGQAKLEDIKAQSRQRDAAATKLPPGTVTPLQQAALQFGIANDLVAPQELTYRGPKTQIMADGISQREDFKKWYETFKATGKAPGVDTFNPKGADVGFAGSRQAAVTPEGPAFQMKIRGTASILPQLKTLDTLSKEIPRSDVQYINSKGIKIAAGLGNRAANRLQTQAQQIALNMQILYPSGSDQKLDIDLSNLSESKTVEQLQDSIKLVFKDVVNRRNALIGQPFDFLKPQERALGLYPTTEAEGATPSGPPIGSPAAPTSIPNGTIIKNKNGTRMKLINGKWNTIQ